MSIELKKKMKRVNILFKYFNIISTVNISLDQFKVIDTRRVKVPARNGKSATNQQIKNESTIEHSSSSSNVISSTASQSSTSQIPTTKSSSVSQLSNPSSSNSEIPTVPPDYRFLLAWSYYLASQAAWLSPMFQQQGQMPPSLPTDSESVTKFLQAMQSAMEPLTTVPTSNNNTNNDDDEQIENELESENNNTLFVVKEEANGSEM